MKLEGDSGWNSVIRGRPGVISWVLPKIALENAHFQTVYTLKQCVIATFKTVRASITTDVFGLSNIPYR